MEGLIPFVYRAIVQYRSGAEIGSALYYAGAGGGFLGATDSSSPSRAGAYVRLSSGDSGRFRGVQDVMPPAFGGASTGAGRPGPSAPSPSHPAYLQAPLRRSASRRRSA